MDCSPPVPLSMGFSRQYWSGLPCPPPGDLPHPGFLHCRQILYHLSHQGSPFAIRFNVFVPPAIWTTPVKVISRLYLIKFKAQFSILTWPLKNMTTLITLSLKNFWLHPEVCGTLVSQPGIEPLCLALESGVLTTRTPGRSFFKKKKFFLSLCSTWNKFLPLAFHTPICSGFSFILLPFLSISKCWNVPKVYSLKLFPTNTHSLGCLLQGHGFK